MGSTFFGSEGGRDKVLKEEILQKKKVLKEEKT
jgi:hypothetical protein